MLRFIVIILMIVIFFLVFSLPLYLILWIVGKLKGLETRSRFAQAIVAFIFRLIIKLAGVKLTVHGLEHVPKDKAIVYVANHRGFFDIIIGYTLVPGITGFIAKKEVQHVPFLSWWMYFVNCLFLDRDNLKEGLKTILEGIKRLKNGISIFVFPEGTRSRTDRMLPFKEGTMKLAEKSGAPIVPVTFVGTGDIFENQFPRVRPGHIIVDFGQPVYMQELEKEEKRHLGAKMQETIQNTYDLLFPQK
ncbi:MAG: 1-acyl-sn-glycerol-3-phosphate acyltransferase [Lachnospiraceae bacterium]|nr:1-acyl-sn-glycerol-3-phosphate acyltransferase [Lachnospiraceae bacterium]